MKVVEDAAKHANDELNHNNNFKNMLDLQHRLNVYDLIRPDRTFIKEGELKKISRNSTDPRYLFLLNDVLLYATYTKFIGDSNHLKRMIFRHFYL